MSLDFVSIVAVECRAGLMGHGGVFLSGDGLIPSDWGHSVGGRNHFCVYLPQMTHQRGIPEQSPE